MGGGGGGGGASAFKDGTAGKGGNGGGIVLLHLKKLVLNGNIFARGNCIVHCGFNYSSRILRIDTYLDFLFYDAYYI